MGLIILMTPEEAQERYQRARRIADGLLLGSICGQESQADYHDALEIAFLWRLALEGARFSPMTNARLIEATNPEPPPR